MCCFKQFLTPVYCFPSEEAAVPVLDLTADLWAVTDPSSHTRLHWTVSSCWMQQRGSARRDASMSAVMLLRSWLDSLGSVVCPDVLDSHSAWEQEKRNDWDQASSWGGILTWIWHHGAELMDRRLWEFFTYIHAPRLGTKREGGVNTLSRRRPVVVPGYQRVRQLKCPLTYGKMESGAEASPQHLPRRKAVLHSLEDQKRVSY